MSEAIDSEHGPEVRRFKPYPEYKDSGVEWLGEIPAHWEVRALKRLGHMQAGRAITSQGIERAGQYPVYGGNGIRGYADSFTHDGDFPLIGRQGALCGCVNFASGKFWASEHAVVVTPDARVEVHWLVDLLEAMSLNQYSQSAAQPGLTVETIGAIEVPVPPVTEQRAVVALLDRETTRIDALVEKHERLIELLQEQRTALITSAVTKGLDPSVQMKDSGVEWLGEIPAHWITQKIKRLFRQTKRQGHGDLTVLSVYRDFGVVEKSSRDDNFNRTPEDLHVYQLVSPGDLVINKMKAWQGSLGVSRHLGITSPDYVVYTPRHAENGRFLHHFLRNNLLANVYRAMSNGIRPSQWRLEPERFEDLPVFLPPLAEQEQIIIAIDRQTARIDTLVANLREAVTRFKELRSALISAAVTGKIDVRSASVPAPPSNLTPSSLAQPLLAPTQDLV